MRSLLIAAVSGVAFLAQPAVAQTYPSKPIHILVPYAPGGIADIASRIIGAKLTEAWGQQVVVENRPGANGFIAMTAGAKAAPDGYTLTMATVGDVAINPALFKDMPYDMVRDFAPISAISDAPMVLRGQRQRAVQDGRRRCRRSKGPARTHFICDAGQRQRQPDRHGVDGAQHRHAVPAHPPTRAARRPQQLLQAATFRSAYWQARRPRRM